MGIDGVVDQDVGDLRLHDDFHRPVERHHRRHPRRQARAGRPAALPALGEIGEARLQPLLILGRQRRLLAETPRLGRIIGGLTGHTGNADADPLALEIGILGVVERRRRRAYGNDSRHRHGRCETSCKHLSSSPPSRLRRAPKRAWMFLAETDAGEARRRLRLPAAVNGAPASPSADRGGPYTAPPGRKRCGDLTRAC